MGNSNSIKGDIVTFELKQYRLVREDFEVVVFTDGKNERTVSRDRFPTVQQEDVFSGDYNDLTNKPDIPSDIGDLTDTTGKLRGVRSFQKDDGDPDPTGMENGDLLFIFE